MSESSFVSRAGQKLDHALKKFGIDVNGKVCADFGCSTGGFTDCLLSRGAKKVYAIDTGYGVLDWGLRNDKRVIVLERTNALHVELPEKVDVVVIDVGWTPQRLIVPKAAELVKPGGCLVSLIKPHYEVGQDLSKGKGRSGKTKVAEFDSRKIADGVVAELKEAGFDVKGLIESPVPGKRSENVEFLVWIQVK